MASTLIEWGVELNCIDYGGATTLSSAADDGQEPVVKLLISIDGVNSNMKDFNEMTALMLAAENGHDSVSTLLEPQGRSRADPSSDRTTRGT